MILLKRELELVDALGDMEIAQKLITASVMTDEVGNELNQLDAHFRSLGLSYMKLVQSGTKELNALALYASETHGATHMHYRANILYAFRVERQLETEAWVKSGYDKLGEGERLLLWHGSRTTNFAGILKQGLRIAPPEAPVTGYMFGKGVYFADMMSKSANYCYAHLSESVGLLLLCEVAAKPVFEQLQSNYNADRDCKANNKLATLGVGRTQPVHWKDAGEALDNDDLQGCHMPKGPAVNVGNPNVCLEYNEYIVYDPSQIRVRYLLMVQMG
ncbi:hypothetical protein SERLA73DRAFT_190681 [Serpula lacrymans var. lacrymans S7.3]|uniref:Poly [ADP-ribose] polymerase n=2 Tax=Serpula lacrymans var. lacrymans TaxID=341189 RepID=F8QG60_SERL3|nr:hypothetical protein SERLA73DRAFT_190681 [Serpula lacrymans var. lacrymans S7.3]